MKETLEIVGFPLPPLIEEKPRAKEATSLFIVTQGFDVTRQDQKPLSTLCGSRLPLDNLVVLNNLIFQRVLRKGPFETSFFRDGIYFNSINSNNFLL